MSKFCLRSVFACLLALILAASASVPSRAESPSDSDPARIEFAQILLTGALPELESYLQRVNDRSVDGSVDLRYLNAPAFGPWSPLCLAAARGRAEVVHRLLAAGASLKVPCTISQPYSPLLLAAYSGSVSTVRVILESPQMSPEVLEAERRYAHEHGQRNLGLVFGSFNAYLKQKPGGFQNPNLEPDEGIGAILNANCSICQKYFLDDVLEAKCCKQTLCKSCATGWSENRKEAGVTCPFCRRSLTAESLSRVSPFEWSGRRPEFFDAGGWPVHFPRPQAARPSRAGQILPSAPQEDAPLPSAPPFEAPAEEAVAGQIPQAQYEQAPIPIWQLKRHAEVRDQFFKRNKKLLGQFFKIWCQVRSSEQKLELLNHVMDVLEDPRITLEWKRHVIKNLTNDRQLDISLQPRPYVSMRHKTIELVNWLQRNPLYLFSYSSKDGLGLLTASSQVFPIDFLQLPERFRYQDQDQAPLVQRQTRSGAVYTQVLNHPKLGTAWMDPRGLLWSDRYMRGRGGAILELTWREAREHCFNLNGMRKAKVVRAFEEREEQMRLPRQEYYLARKRGFELEQLYLITLSQRQPGINGCYLPSREELANYGVDSSESALERQISEKLFSESDNRLIWSGSAHPNLDADAFYFSGVFGDVVGGGKGSPKAFRCVCGDAVAQ